MKTRLFILFFALAMQVVCADAVIKTIDEENVIDVCVSADKKTTTVIYYKEKKGILAKGKEYYVLQNDTLFGPYDELNYLGDKKKEVPIFLWRVHNQEGFFVVTNQGLYGAYDEVEKLSEVYYGDASYHAKNDNVIQCFLNGNASIVIDRSKYSQIDLQGISPDCSKIAVIDTWFDEYNIKHKTLYINDEKILTSDYINYFEFSPNSKHYAYVYSGYENDEYYFCVRLDDTVVYKSTNIPNISRLRTFLSNNELSFYVSDYSKSSSGYTIYIGQRKIGVDSYPEGIIASADGKKVAFVSGNYVYVEDEKIGPYSEIQDLQFYSDNETVIYKARTSEGWYVCANREKNGPFKEVKNLILSPNKDNITWIARHKNDQYYVHVAEKEYGPYEQAYIPVFSYDGQNIVYETKEIQSSTHYSYSETYVRVGEERFGPFDKVYKYLFASDGKTLMYLVREKMKYAHEHTNYVYIGKEKFRATKDVNNIIFASNGLHFCYLDAVEEGDYIVLDELKKIGPFDNIENINFTPSGKVISFSTKINSIPYMKIALFEGDEMQVYTGSFYNGHLVYVKDGKIMIREEAFEKK